MVCPRVTDWILWLIFNFFFIILLFITCSYLVSVLQSLLSLILTIRRACVYSFLATLLDILVLYGIPILRLRRFYGRHYTIYLKVLWLSEVYYYVSLVIRLIYYHYDCVSPFV